MLAKLIITFAALLFGLGVPLLEINQTHVCFEQLIISWLLK